MPSQKITKWNWTGQRLKAAEMVAVSEKTQEQIAKECGVRRETISIWNSQPEFKEKVAELVLLDERATKAGILKRALKTLEEKSKSAPGDKSTELDYLKFIADLGGLTKQTIHHEGQQGINVVFYLPGNQREQDPKKVGEGSVSNNSD